VPVRGASASPATHQAAGTPASRMPSTSCRQRHCRARPHSSLCAGAPSLPRHSVASGRRPGRHGPCGRPARRPPCSAGLAEQAHRPTTAAATPPGHCCASTSTRRGPSPVRANRPAYGRRRPGCPRTPPELSLIGNGRILWPPSLVLPGGREVTREMATNCVKAGRTWHGTAGGAGTARFSGRRSG
jgi:hypothetical protein